MRKNSRSKPSCDTKVLVEVLDMRDLRPHFVTSCISSGRRAFLQTVWFLFAACICFTFSCKDWTLDLKPEHFCSAGQYLLGPFPLPFQQSLLCPRLSCYWTPVVSFDPVLSRLASAHRKQSRSQIYSRQFPHSKRRIPRGR